MVEIQVGWYLGSLCTAVLFGIGIGAMVAVRQHMRGYEEGHAKGEVSGREKEKADNLVSHEKVLTAILDARQMHIRIHQYGPFEVVCSPLFYHQLRRTPYSISFKCGTNWEEDRSLKDRILQIAGIEKVTIVDPDQDEPFYLRPIIDKARMVQIG